MRFGRGANVRFHLAYASVRKHLLLQARQRCRDFHLTRIRRQFVVYFCLHTGKFAGKHGKLASRMELGCMARPTHALAAKAGFSNFCVTSRIYEAVAIKYWEIIADNLSKAGWT